MLNQMYGKSLVLCAIISLTCANLPSLIRIGRSSEVVGGRTPVVGEVKYIVVVHSYRSICGGGIIGDRFILTAAHCVKVDANSSTLLKPMEIIAGTNVVSGNKKAQVIKIDGEKAYLPKVYVKGARDDIAVLKVENVIDDFFVYIKKSTYMQLFYLSWLKEPFNLIRDYNKVQVLDLPKPLSIDSSRYPTYENMWVKFAGYGNTHAQRVTINGKNEIQRSGAGLLQVANAFINDTIACKKFFINVGDNKMCLSVIEDKTKQRPQGTCRGDSGSPAVYDNNIVIGVDSSSILCDNNKAPSLFTRVSSYIPFITKATNGNVNGLVVYGA